MIGSMDDFKRSGGDHWRFRSCFFSIWRRCPIFTEDEISQVEEEITWFIRRNGQFFGIPEEKMSGFQRANQNLEMAKNELQTFLQ